MCLYKERPQFMFWVVIVDSDRQKMGRIVSASYATLSLMVINYVNSSVLFISVNKKHIHMKMNHCFPQGANKCSKFANSLAGDFLTVQ